MKERPLTALAILLVLWIVFCRICGILKPFALSEQLDGTTITCEGTICKIKENNIYINNLNTSIREISRKSQICLKTDEDITEWKLGNRIQAKGRISLAESPGNDGQFDQKAYEQLQGIICSVKKPKITLRNAAIKPLAEKLRQLQAFFKEHLESALTKEDASILSAMILGDQTELQEETRSLFQNAGIVHILAISGLHISLLGMGIYGMFRRLGISFFFSSTVSGSLMMAFGIMTGFGISTRRAVFMFLIYLGAQCLGRTYDLITALSTAVILLLLDNPFWLFWSGFQMSVLAVAGIGILVPVYEECFPLPDVLKVPLAVQLMMLPCVLCGYYRIPVYGLVLNLAILPWMPAVMISGILAVCFSSILPSAGTLAGGGAHYLLLLYETLSKASLRLPGALWTFGKPSGFFVILFYAVLIGVPFVLKRKEGKTVRATLFYGLMLAGSILLLQRPVEKTFSMTFLDVGQGDAICMRTPSGKTMLVDGGSSTVKNCGSRRMQPYLLYHNVKQIDYIFLTHMDSDHTNGIEELLAMDREGIPVKNMVFAEGQRKQEKVKALAEMASQKGISVHYMKAGDTLTTENVSIRCIHPGPEETEETNEASLVLWVQEAQGFDALLTGDLEKDGETTFLQNEWKEYGGKEPLDVLKAGHHGSNGATSVELIDELQPKTIVLSYGKNNRYHHPGTETMERIKNAEIPYLTTSGNGAVTFYCNLNGTVSITCKKQLSDIQRK